ncbi:MAG: acyltransferase family protein [Bacteroidia bacterium]
MKIQSEIPVLDSLRAVAAWSVCLYHFVCMTVGFVDQNGWVYRLFHCGKYGVQMFFVISGLVIPWALYKNSYRIKAFFNFMIKRLIRVEPPYIFSVLVAAGFIYLRKFSPTFDGHLREITPAHFFLHLGYLVPFIDNAIWFNIVYWTLAIEFQYYIFIGLIYFLIVSPKLILRSLGYFVILAAPFVLGSEDFLPRWLPVFGFGIMIFLFKTDLIKIPEFIIMTFLLSGMTWYFTTFKLTMIALLMQLVILFFFNYSNRVLGFFGKFSYSVYLMHAILGGAMVNVLSHYMTGSFSKFGLVAGALVVTGVTSYFTYLYIEKPAKRLSSKIKYGA